MNFYGLASLFITGFFGVLGAGMWGYLRQKRIDEPRAAQDLEDARAIALSRCQKECNDCYEQLNRERHARIDTEDQLAAYRREFGERRP